MRVRIGALSLTAAAIVLLAACGGDDSKAETKTRDGAAATAVAAAQTPTSSSAGGVTGVSSAATAPSSSTARSALSLDCERNLTAFRFDGKLAMRGATSSSANDPSALFSSLLQDVRFSGAYVAPDRTQMKLDLGGKDSPLAGQAFEFIQIGPTSYLKLGNTGWQQQETAGSNPVEELSPVALCKQLHDIVPAAAQSRKEKVNGIDAVRYDYDRKSLEKLPGLLDGMNSSDLPENVRLSLWVAEKERFPVKMTMAASGQQSGGPFSMDLEFNVSDLNSSGIKIEAPR
jgi:hypothetical protein